MLTLWTHEYLEKGDVRLYNWVKGFSFEPSPNYLDLLITSDIELTSQFYLIQKNWSYADVCSVVYIIFSLVEAHGLCSLSN